MQRASASDPARTSNGAISWVRSTTPTCGAMSRMTDLTTPTNSSAVAVVGQERHGVIAPRRRPSSPRCTVASSRAIERHDTGARKRSPDATRAGANPPMAPAPSALPVGRPPARLNGRHSKRRMDLRKESRRKSWARDGPRGPRGAISRRLRRGRFRAPDCVAPQRVRHPRTPRGPPDPRAPRSRRPSCHLARSPSRGVKPDRPGRPATRPIRRATATPSTRRGPGRARPSCPASISASATKKTYAGPDPVSPVTASNCDSGARTVMPTEPRIRSAHSRSSSPAPGPAVIADTPLPTSAGVLGIARTTAADGPAAAAIVAVVTPAAIDNSRRAPAAAASRATSGTSGGFTASTAPSQAGITVGDEHAGKLIGEDRPPIGERFDDRHVVGGRTRPTTASPSAARHPCCRHRRPPTRTPYG